MTSDRRGQPPHRPLGRNRRQHRHGVLRCRRLAVARAARRGRRRPGPGRTRRRRSGCRPPRRHEAVGPLLAALEGSPSTTVALGTWTRGHAAAHRLVARHRAARTSGVNSPVNRSPTGSALAAWIRERTAGRVREAPVAVSRVTELLLLSVLAVRTEWDRAVRARSRPASAPTAAGGSPACWRHSSDLDEVSVADTAAGPLTLFTVRGPGRRRRRPRAIGEPDAARRRRPGARPARASPAPGPRAGSRLAVGTTAPGLTVDDVPAAEPAPLLIVGTIAFAVTGSHDLLARPGRVRAGTPRRSPNGDHLPAALPHPAQDHRRRTGRRRPTSPPAASTPSRSPRWRSRRRRSATRR